jgi:FkbM family methyltransferase
MRQRLERNLILNHLMRSVSVEGVALGDVSTTVRLNIHDDNLGQSSVLALNKSANSIEVQQFPLLHYYPNAERYELFAIKIDVEGREDAVLVPFIDALGDDRLPDCIMMETVLEESWSRPLLRILEERGYCIVAEAEGNALFSRTPESSTNA